MAEAIRSANKTVGWRCYEREKPSFLSRPEATRRELMRLHEVICAPSETPSNEVRRIDFRSQLAMHERPDAAEIERRFKPHYEKITRRVPHEHVFPFLFDAFMASVPPAFAELVVLETLSGHLRQFGKRSLNGGAWETVYAPHTCEFVNNITGASVWYVGLSKGLDEIYALLCDSFDAKMRAAKTQEDRLAALLEFNLVGVRLVHPFWDGNGRTFSAHSDLWLERLGIRLSEEEPAACWVVSKSRAIVEKIISRPENRGAPRELVLQAIADVLPDYLDDVPKGLEFGKPLTPFSNLVLDQALFNNGLRFLPDPVTIPLLFLASKRAAYMSALKKATEDAIRRPDVSIIKTALSYLQYCIRAPMDVLREFNALINMGHNPPEIAERYGELERVMLWQPSEDGFAPRT